MAENVLMSVLGHAWLGLYVLILSVLAVYGGHRYYLIWLYFRHRRRNEPTACFLEPPHVTVQLPMYNERNVARRIIEAAAALDYPRHRLEIQVLDDSTDYTTSIAREAVDRLAAQGLDIVLLHRTNRQGFKAGALAEATAVAKGEFLCIFDADFVPPRDVLRRMVDHFADPQVGAVQARWEHINREQSMLTRIQAILLDGHFWVEHSARNSSGRFMSFNGTAGMWRKSCIDDAGGWQHDTLIEDKDLSFRAQLRGWRMVYRPDISVPAELPPEITAFKAQQHRWTKGGVQTLRKLFRPVMTADIPLKVKIEAFFHLTHCVVYLPVVLLTLMIFPSILLRRSMMNLPATLQAFVDLSIFAFASVSALAYYAVGQRISGRSWWQCLIHLPFLICVGLGIALHNARAVLAGMRRETGEFIRTPKYAVDNNGNRRRHLARSAAAQRPRGSRQAWVELGVGAYFMLCTIVALLDRSLHGTVPFLALFMVGYLYVGFQTWLSTRRAGGAARPPRRAGGRREAPAPIDAIPELATSAVR